ncbi:RND transporter [Sterolibacterium denitrificans]|uniref:RND transporter n=1 Tax=Sterolibacterium denitrificans TaxID=157592 RepID=A0A656Z9F1_9PROT|nr:RND transporter [Sterolibacterium denitrificans]
MLQPGRGRLTGWRSGLLVVLLLILAGGLYLAFFSGKKQQGRYLTEEAALGHLVVSISASGTLAPTRSVDVGSELSGTLEAVLADDNDRVSQGQIMARLDTAKLRDAVTRSQAAVTVAEANVAQAEATLKEQQANLKRLREVHELSGGKVPAASELETAQAAVARAEANRQSAQAAVIQAKAVLTTDQTNIDKAVIRSPINGVVLARKVEPGQTVAAAMTTPVLFSIAEDLTQMELEVRVDEADVSTVQLGQPASFSVAAWSGRRFPATIKRVGLGSTIIDNVVTYKTVLSVANDDLALRPGMTATAQIITVDRENVLLVPTAALRYVPQQAGNGSDEKAGDGGSYVDKLLPRMPRRAKKAGQTAPRAGGSGQLWVLEQGQPRRIDVQLGASNGRQTEITGGELKPGMQVITDYLLEAT